MIGSTDEDTLLLEEQDDDVHVYIRHTKDFRFVTVNRFSPTSSKVFLVDAADPLSSMELIWECEGLAHCIMEHHLGELYLFTDASKGHEPVDSHYLLRSPLKVDSTSRIWEHVFFDDPDLVIVDVDFSHTHLVLILRGGREFRLCAVRLPLPVGGKGPINLKELELQFLPLPKHVSQISSGPNYDFYSSTMRFTISSPVMPDAVVDYNLSDGKFNIIQQQSILHERTRILYGTTSSAGGSGKISNALENSVGEANLDDDQLWNSLSEYYACEHFNVSSDDGVLVPLTIVYSYKCKKENENPGLLHVHGAYGELLDKRWRSELKSLLDRGWVIAYADVRGGGGGGKKWHQNGRRIKKFNSVQDYISCAKFLAERRIVNEEKLAGWGYSAGGLLVASAINQCPELFRAAILKVPFLDPINTLLHPIIPLTPADYEEFGYPGLVDDFHAIRRYSPYDNIQKDVAYPAVLITSSFNTRFGVWEAAKWIARVRDYSIYDPKRPVILNLTTDIVEENRYLHCKESALETAFLIKAMES